MPTQAQMEDAGSVPDTQDQVPTGGSAAWAQSWSNPNDQLDMFSAAYDPEGTAGVQMSPLYNMMAQAGITDANERARAAQYAANSQAALGRQRIVYDPALSNASRNNQLASLAQLQALARGDRGSLAALQGRQAMGQLATSAQGALASAANSPLAQRAMAMRGNQAASGLVNDAAMARALESQGFRNAAGGQLGAMRGQGLQTAEGLARGDYMNRALNEDLSSYYMQQGIKGQQNWLDRGDRIGDLYYKLLRANKDQRNNMMQGLIGGFGQMMTGGGLAGLAQGAVKVGQTFGQAAMNQPVVPTGSLTDVKKY